MEKILNHISLINSCSHEAEGLTFDKFASSTHDCESEQYIERESRENSFRTNESTLPTSQKIILDKLLPPQDLGGFHSSKDYSYLLKFVFKFPSKKSQEILNRNKSKVIYYSNDEYELLNPKLKKKYLFSEFQKHVNMCDRPAKFKVRHKPCKNILKKKLIKKMHCLTRYCKKYACIKIRYARSMDKLKSFVDIEKTPFAYHGEIAFRRGVIKNMPIKQQKKILSRILLKFEKETGLKILLRIFDIEIINMFKKGKEYPLLHFHFLGEYDKDYFILLKSLKQKAIEMSANSKKGYSFFFKLNENLHELTPKEKLQQNKEIAKLRLNTASQIKHFKKYVKHTKGILNYFAKRMAGILGHDKTPYDPLNKRKFEDIMNNPDIYFLPDFMSIEEYFNEIYNSRTFFSALKCLGLYRRDNLTSAILSKLPPICPFCQGIIDKSNISLHLLPQPPPNPQESVEVTYFLIDSPIYSPAIESIFKRIGDSASSEYQERERQDIFALGLKIGCTLEQLKRLGLT